MTEADEVAASLLPGYLGWRNARHANLVIAPVERYVMRELSATESYITIDAVTASLKLLVIQHDKGRQP